MTATLPAPARRRGARAVAAALFCCLFTAGGAAAQGVIDADSMTQSTKVFDGELVYPMPSWSTGKKDAFEMLRESVVTIRQNAEQYYQAQTPTGTTLQDAVRVYSISGVDLSSIGQDVPLPAYVATLAPAVSQRCEPNAFGSQSLEDTDEAATLLVHCTAFRSVGGQSRIGRGDHTAFLSLVRVLKYRNAFIQVNHDWFGPGYEFGDEASWPVSREELDRMRARYGLISFSAKTAQ